MCYMGNRDTKTILKKLKKEGWSVIPGGKGGHIKITNGEKTTTIPNRKDNDPRFIKDLEKQTGVTLL